MSHETPTPPYDIPEPDPSSDISKVISATRWAVLLKLGPDGFPGELDPSDPKVRDHIAKLITERDGSKIPPERLKSEFQDEMSVQIVQAQKEIEGLRKKLGTLDT